ncbi:MAG: hypothetical protein PHH49_03100 [Candidatus Omnitrophica bacterium]|nr:hypothetical protein [Candidatus Omnitrophota bacterium]
MKWKSVIGINTAPQCNIRNQSIVPEYVSAIGQKMYPKLHMAKDKLANPQRMFIFEWGFLNITKRAREKAPRKFMMPLIENRSKLL